MTSFLYWGLRQNEACGLQPVSLSSRDGRLQSSTKSFRAFLLSFVLPWKHMHALLMLSPMLHSWCMTSMLCIRINAAMYESSHSAHLWVNCVSLHNFQNTLVFQDLESVYPAYQEFVGHLDTSAVPLWQYCPSWMCSSITWTHTSGATSVYDNWSSWSCNTKKNRKRLRSWPKIWLFEPLLRWSIRDHRCEDLIETWPFYYSHAWFGDQMDHVWIVYFWLSDV
jgi:hypothetical protein